VQKFEGAFLEGERRGWEERRGKRENMGGGMDGMSIEEEMARNGVY